MKVFPKLVTWVALGTGLLPFILGISAVLVPSLDFSGQTTDFWLYSLLFNQVFGWIAVSSNTGVHKKVAIIAIILGSLGFLIPFVFMGM